MTLSAKQRKALRGLAHSLSPRVQVGKGRVTPEIAAQLDAALDAHELVKVRFLGGREEKDSLVAELARSTGAAAVGGIGHVAIFYRPHPEPERRRVRLPAGRDPG